MTLVEGEWAAARTTAAHLPDPLPAESVDVPDAAGRVLAVDCAALCDLPLDDTSAMDGWAVAGTGPWRIVGDVRTGVPHGSALRPGQSVRIATGGVMPVGSDGVMRWEVATVAGDVLNGPVEPGQDIRRAGEECRTGESIATAGTEISPALAGLLAATGHDTVQVARRPRAGLLLLGDELQATGIPAPGRVRDSLGPQLPGWLERMGAVVTVRTRVPDELDALVAALADVAAECDLVITTGSTAAGPRDHLHEAIARAGGTLHVDRVAVKPGHPMLLASLHVGERIVPIVGLPGNPHSAISGLVTLGQPVIASMLGRRRAEPSFVPTEEDLRSPAGHTRLVAGNLVDERFVLSPYGGSAMLRGLAQSTGFAVVPAGMTPAGTTVEWVPLP